MESSLSPLPSPPSSQNLLEKEATAKKEAGGYI